MKFLVMPDSFKGSVSAIDFCKIAETTICQRFPDAIVECAPICDGGEGSVDCLNALFDGKTFSAKVTDGNFIKRFSKFGYNQDCAFIAVSESSGLANTMIKDPFITTTFGMGEQILQAKHLGKKKIILCLGGSSTNDGGAGLLCALGCKFFDKNGESFIPTGNTLLNIESIDTNELNKTIQDLSFTALCDVTNPLLGPNGCSFIYARQKGAKSDQSITLLENNMRHFASVSGFLGYSPDTPGAGAAGGLGYCILAFLKGKMTSGIDYILDAIDFDKKASDADFILTGEGKFDNTSFSGKAIGGIKQRADKLKKPVIVFCGQNASNMQKNIYEINDPDLSLAQNIANTERNLSQTITKFLSTI